MLDRQKHTLQSKLEELEIRAREEVEKSQKAKNESVLGYVNAAMSEFFGQDTGVWPEIKIPERPEIYSTDIDNESADPAQISQDARLVHSLKQTMLKTRLLQASVSENPVNRLWGETISELLLVHPKETSEQEVNGRASISINLVSPGCFAGIKRVRAGLQPEIPYATLRTEVESDFASVKAEGENFSVSKDITYPQLFIERTIWETVNLENSQVPRSFIISSTAELAKPNTDRTNWPEQWNLELRIGPESKATLPDSEKTADWSLKLHVKNRGSEGTKLVSSIVKDKPLSTEFWDYVEELTANPGVSIDDINIEAGSTKKQTGIIQKTSLYIPTGYYGPLSDFIGGPVILEEINGELFAGISNSAEFSPDAAIKAANWIRSKVVKSSIENLLGGLFQLKPGDRLKIKYPDKTD